MKKLGKKERISFIATGILLLSIILIIIIIIITEILNYESHPNPELAINKGILPTIIIHLLIFISYLVIIGINRRDVKKKTGYIIIWILLILFGLTYVNGAVAFSNNENILYLSYLMFTIVLFDIIAPRLVFKAIK